MTTLVDSIAIPATYQALCGRWSGGVDCMLYAVASTGGLTLGSVRPIGCDSPEEWYLHIWRELSCDVDAVANMADKAGDVDYPLLVAFSVWIDSIITRLEVELPPATVPYTPTGYYNRWGKY